MSRAETLSLVKGTPPGDLVTGQPDDAVQLNACPRYERIIVRTCRSVYEIVVLSGGVGDVIVRGGGFFQEFQRATLAGSTFGGSALKPNSICVGLHMELHAGGKSVVTSRIQSVSRAAPAFCEQH